MVAPAFVHTHVHSHYSLLDGAAQVEDLVEAAVSCEQPALALTDHGNLCGAVPFYKACVAKGVKPIVGLEAYLAPRSRHDRTKNPVAAHHLILLAMNETGYRNLIRLSSRSFTEGFYYVPRIDKELLARHSEGLIAQSACLSGEPDYYVRCGDPARARQAAAEMKDIFGDRYYLELQRNGCDGQEEVNQGLRAIAAELRIPLVATNDVHYVAEDDREAHEVHLCIGTGKTLKDANRLKPESLLCYKASDPMYALFRDVEDAPRATLDIASRCDLRLDLGTMHLPRFEAPGGEENVGYFRRLCREGAARRYGAPLSPAVEARLAEETAVVEQMGFVAYFLIVWDFIRHAKERGIPVGPGRGSAAGSLVAYSLGITNVDPLRHDLLFERFLNRERISMPDIDIDFCKDGREEVIRYVQERYGGRERVSQIVTFGTMAARAVVRDVGRVLDIPLRDVDALAKKVPNGPNASLVKALDTDPDLKAEVDKDERFRRLAEIARRLEGLNRNASKHAAGVVIADAPLEEYVPLYRVGDDLTTQFTMDVLEDIGLLKMDFLGLRTLTILAKAVGNVRRSGDAKGGFAFTSDPGGAADGARESAGDVAAPVTSPPGGAADGARESAGDVAAPVTSHPGGAADGARQSAGDVAAPVTSHPGGAAEASVGEGAAPLSAPVVSPSEPRAPSGRSGSAPAAQAGTSPGLDLDAIPENDPATFAMLSRGEALGVFQLESSGMRELLTKIRPDRFEDLSAIVALYRPGPLGSGMVDQYVERKHGRQPISYLHPTLEPILRETLGVIVYQEQVMRIANVLAGFSLNEADTLRKAMGKKRPEVMAKFREKFLKGCVARSIPEATAIEIWTQMEFFAGYGFNKSHTVAYAVVTYQTAWLKCHHPREFMAALLTCESGDRDKLSEYLDEARRMRIRVLPPDVSRSARDFAVEGDAIRFGLGAVKGVGEAASEAIVAAREAGGPFESVFDLCERVPPQAVNRSSLEALVKAGAFDSTGARRAQAFEVLDRALSLASAAHDDRSTGQMGLFGAGGSASGGGEGSLGPAYPEVPEWPMPDLLAHEKDVLGYYVTAHPLARFEPALRRHAGGTASTLRDAPERTVVRLGGLVTGLRTSVIKNGPNEGKKMAFFRLEDFTGSASCVMFSRAWAEHAARLGNDRVVFVEGDVDASRDEPTLRVSKVVPVDEADCAFAKGVLVRLTEPTSAVLASLRASLQATPGALPVAIEIRTIVDGVPASGSLESPVAQRVVVKAGASWSVAADPELPARLRAIAGVADARFLHREP